MALIDEYKQAIQDVLDGRAKPAPKPSELPWTEDKAATMWAAAAAELIAEANGGDALPDTPGTDGTYALQNTVEGGTGTLFWGSGGGGGGLLVTVTYDAGLGLHVCDKTAGEMWESAQNGGAVVFRLIDGSSTDLYALESVFKRSDGYEFTMSTGEHFDADSDSGYPSGYVS